MTIYFVTVGKKEYKVEIQQDQFRVNGQPFDLKLQPLNANGLYLIERGRRKLEMLLKAQNRNLMSVMLDTCQMTIRVDRNSRKQNNRAGNVSEGSILAPMPGVVTELHVAEGQTVERNQVLVTLESMKMQMEIRAPEGGRVEKTTACAGAKVEKGSLLVQIKPE